jgi:hypothetical protein
MGCCGKRQWPAAEKWFTYGVVGPVGSTCPTFSFHRVLALDFLTATSLAHGTCFLCRRGSHLTYSEVAFGWR